MGWHDSWVALMHPIVANAEAGAVSFFVLCDELNFSYAYIHTCWACLLHGLELVGPVVAVGVLVVHV